MDISIRDLKIQLKKSYEIDLIPSVRLRELKHRENAYRFLMVLNSPQSQHLLQQMEHSKAQIFQDIFVLSCLEMKRDGFFVEFGATNGIDLSNTYLLEQRFGWKGILAEPARTWHAALKKNRTAIIDKRCVWSQSRKRLKFKESNDAEYSTISAFADKDGHAKVREKHKEYSVTTVSLTDLLDSHNAPELIDYLSLDTEGSELEILQAFDFSKYRFKVITCEHNNTGNREHIYQLLSSNGYRRVFTNLSRFDDWYILDASLQAKAD